MQPSDIPPPPSSEADIAAAASPVLVRVAAGVLLLASAVVALTGIQTTMITRMVGPAAIAPYILIVLGAGGLVLAVPLFRARAWSAVAATVIAAALAVSSSAWLAFSVSRGLLSLYATFAPFAAVGALVFAALSIGPCVRATAARDRLAARGMSFGL
jgi:hypothetical protein